MFCVSVTWYAVFNNAVVGVNIFLMVETYVDDDTTKSIAGKASTGFDTVIVPLDISEVKNPFDNSSAGCSL